MRHALLAAGLLAVLAIGGCRIESSLVPAPAKRAHETVPAQRGGGGSPGGGSASSDGYGYSPNCPTPENHCLADDDVIVAERALDNRPYVHAHVGVQQGGASGDGEATFFMRHNGEETVTRHYYRTRPAATDELAVGMRVAMFNRNKNDNIYDPPEDRESAHGKRWWIARIASVDPLEHGYVIVTGGHKVRAVGLRALEGDDSPTTAVTGSEDEHFLRETHYLVTSGRVKEGGYSHLQIGAPIREPSAETRGEGHFIQLNNGNVYWTENAWRTRRATESDISVGTRVFMFNRNKDNDIYGPPDSRVAALTKRWWTAKVTDDSQLYKGVVIVAGKYAVSLDALRVAY